MRNARIRLVALGVAGLLAGLAGCAVNPPLMFGDSVSFGLQIASDAGGTGNGGSIGYRQRSIAVVPVSVIDDKGDSQVIRGDANRGGKRDALSVFASFEAFVDPSGTDDVDLGQVFATGTAAQVVTGGLRCKMLRAVSCAPDANAQAALQAAARADAAASRADHAAAKAGAAAATTAAVTKTAAGLAQPPASKPPYQVPLFFGRTDTLGIALGGSSAEGGAQFDLGFSVRNVALIPTYSRDGHGNVIPLGSGQDSNHDNTPEMSDALSVMGQFKANAKTKALGLKLNRYFATGVAAQELAEGLHGAMVAAAAASAAAGTGTAGAAPAATLAQAPLSAAP